MHKTDRTLWRYIDTEEEWEAFFNGGGPVPVLGTDYILDQNGDALMPYGKASKS